MSLSIKPGVILGNLSPQMLVALMVVRDAFAAFEEPEDQRCVITSGSDGQHMMGSKHYQGNGLDFRTSYLSKSQEEHLAIVLRGRLGNEFDVVLESDHLHVEYDPK